MLNPSLAKLKEYELENNPIKLLLIALFNSVFSYQTFNIENHCFSSNITIQDLMRKVAVDGDEKIFYFMCLCTERDVIAEQFH